MERKHSKEHKEKISKSIKAWHKKKGYVPAWNKGGTTSELTKEKQRQAKLINPTRYWLGKKRPNVGKKIAKKLSGKINARGCESKIWKGGSSTWWRNQARKTMETKLGRKLNKQQEVVHHIDGNYTNNSINNLIVLSRAKHASIHDFGRHIRAHR